MCDELNERPVVSIIVPVYNAERYLRECLDSLVNQSFQAIEVLAVDDGSTDGSADILADYAARDARVKVIEQENGGVSRARNTGLDRATGEFVLFVDSDDYIRLDACEFLVGRARAEKADIVVFGGKTFPTKPWADASFAKRDQVYRGKEVIEALLVEPGGVPLMCNKLYSVALLEKIGARLPVGLSLGEDHVFQLRVFPHASCVAYTGEALYFYRNHEGSTLNADDDEVRETRVFKHLEVVWAIAEDWRKAGLIASRGTELLGWFASFLNIDLPLVSFNNRELASAEFATIVDEYFMRDDFGRLNDEIWKWLDDMLFSRKAFDADPVVTFVVSDVTDGVLPMKSIRSILNQSEQRLRCLIDSRFSSKEVERILEKDRRCSVVDLSSLEEVIAKIDSPYVVFAPSNCQYRRSAVDWMIRDMDSVNRMSNSEDRAPARQSREELGLGVGACDLFVFKDHAGCIEMIDPYERVQPQADEPFGNADVLCFRNFNGWINSILSLSTANKMFSTEFLSDHCPQGGCAPYDAPVQASLAVQFANDVIVRPLPLLSYGAYSYDDDGADWGVARAIAAFHDYREHIEGDYLRGFDEALVRFCLTADIALPMGSRNESVRNAISAVLDSVSPDAVGALEEEDASLIQSFLHDEQDEHRSKLTVVALERSRKQANGVMREFDELGTQAEMLRCEVDDYRNSISYRTGRAVTGPLRVCYYGLKRVIGRLR